MCVCVLPVGQFRALRRPHQAPQARQEHEATKVRQAQWASPSVCGVGRISVTKVGYLLPSGMSVTWVVICSDNNSQFWAWLQCF